MATRSRGLVDGALDDALDENALRDPAYAADEPPAPASSTPGSGITVAIRDAQGSVRAARLRVSNLFGKVEMSCAVCWARSVSQAQTTRAGNAEDHGDQRDERRRA